MRTVAVVNTVTSNKFITTEEVQILWHHVQKCGPKWRAMLAICIFRGLRIGEVLAIRLSDFNQDYDKLEVILEKSNIYDRLPLMKELSAIIKDYVMNNLHRFKDGYLFPVYSSKGTHMTPGVAGSWISKMRREIGREHPEFLDKKSYPKSDVSPDDNDRLRARYRIGWHSLRRYFETSLADSGCSPEFIARIMRYKDVNTVYTYLDPYRVWRQEREILDRGFGPLYNLLSDHCKGQTTLSNFT